MKSQALIQVALAASVSSHIFFTVPLGRGNSLITNDEWPYGMQWSYPCGGLGTTKNRTYWPKNGGPIAWQPGWQFGHITAIHQINLGYGTDGPDNGPMNMSNIMVKPFQVLGPTNFAWPGTVCLPQVPLPAGANVRAGDLATIQIVELAQHGAALYACSDIIFVEDDDPRLTVVNETNCFNSSYIGFADVVTITTKAPVLDTDTGITPASAADSLHRYRWAGWLPLIAGAAWMAL